MYIYNWKIISITKLYTIPQKNSKERYYLYSFTYNLKGIVIKDINNRNLTSLLIFRYYICKIIEEQKAIEKTKVKYNLLLLS